MENLLTILEIQLLMVIVMTGSLLAQTTNSSSSDPDLKETVLGRLPLNDVQFTEDVLLDVSARSRIECSKKCVETEGCVMCTFPSSPQGPPGHCRLHSQLQTAADGKQSMPGAKSLARRRTCNGSYVLLCDRCLKAGDGEVKYTTARQDCTDTQGGLAGGNSPEELDCIRSFAKDNEQHFASECSQINSGKAMILKL
ncbi:hypothetical protein ACOMHN_012495 [Nucella lapillus]